MLRAGVGLWGGRATGPGERCEVPSGVPKPPRVLMLFVFSDDLSYYENPACTGGVAQW